MSAKGSTFPGIDNTPHINPRVAVEIRGRGKISIGGIDARRSRQQTQVVQLRIDPEVAFYPRRL